MKQLKTIKTVLILLSINMFVFTSCSEDSNDDILTNNNEDELEINLSPTLNYDDTTIEATFYKAGHTTTLPTVNWHGDEGRFSLSTSIDGLSINATNGELNWTENLPLGTYELEVIATNSAGSTSTSLTLNNPFQGKFITSVGMTTSHYTINFDRNLSSFVYVDNYSDFNLSTYMYGYFHITGDDYIELNFINNTNTEEYRISGELILHDKAPPFIQGEIQISDKNNNTLISEEIILFIELPL